MVQIADDTNYTMLVIVYTQFILLDFCHDIQEVEYIIMYVIY